MVMTSSRPPGVGRDARLQDFVDHADRQALEQRDALAQRRLEFDLAAHGAFGDGGDMGLQPDEIGQFVDAFLADHGGIHVGEKKLLAPRRNRLHDDVDRQVAARLAQARFHGLDVLASRKGDVDRDLVEQPFRLAGRGQRGERAVDDRASRARGSAGLQIRVATRDMQAGSSGLRKAVLIAGPTASGKSALALDLAQKFGGVVINADSMQVYRDLRIITARPTVEEEARVPHRLYGHVDAAINFSAGAWVADAAKALARGACAEKAADLCRRLRSLFQGADARACRRSRQYRQRFARTYARGWSATASRRCMPSSRVAIPSPPSD